VGIVRDESSVVDIKNCKNSPTAHPYHPEILLSDPLTSFPHIPSFFISFRSFYLTHFLSPFPVSKTMNPFSVLESDDEDETPKVVTKTKQGIIPSLHYDSLSDSI
jgi:hypothetical protein